MSRKLKLHIFRIISLLFATITIILASYNLLNPDSTEISPLSTQFFLGCMVFFLSLSSFKDKHRLQGIISLLASLFVFTVFTWTLIQNN